MISKTHIQYFTKRILALVFALMVFGSVVAGKASAIQTDGTNLSSGPVLLVTDYTVVEGDRSPGSSFVLQMNIANLSALESAYNVVATLKIENLSVSLQEGVTNQQYFREIRPMETVSLQFPMEVYSYCVEENMILSMTMSCHDSVAVHYDFQTMMTPDIDMARTLNVTSLAVPQFVHRNSSMIVSATLHNPNIVTLNNIRMHVVTKYGEEVTEVGQLLTEESKTVDYIYRFSEQKTEDVQVYFTYESLYGHEFTTDPQTYQVVVYDPVGENDISASGKPGVKEIATRLVQGIPLPNTELRIPIPAIVLLLIGFVGYGRILYVVLFKKKKEE